ARRERKQSFVGERRFHSTRANDARERRRAEDTLGVVPGM
ncbi:MAG: Methyltransferase type 11, partial [uncultured Sphingomonadaceae bacterium]